MWPSARPGHRTPCASAWRTPSTPSFTACLPGVQASGTSGRPRRARVRRGLAAAAAGAGTAPGAGAGDGPRPCLSRHGEARCLTSDRTRPCLRPPRRRRRRRRRRSLVRRTRRRTSWCLTWVVAPSTSRSCASPTLSLRSRPRQVIRTSAARTSTIGSSVIASTNSAGSTSRTPRATSAQLGGCERSVSAQSASCPRRPRSPSRWTRCMRATTSASVCHGQSSRSCAWTSSKTPWTP
mmetsp:Transcript_65901/g.192797  ORF Transcript_65901/g.192797 Transcript_65901/m.192797 type:complete len:237 (-) Transcript_65901:1089-1799(-)